MKIKTGLITILILGVLFLNGCLSCSENMILNKDFSGKANIKFAITDVLLGMMGQSSTSVLKEIEKTFTSSPKIKLINSKTYSEMGNQVFVLDIEFTSIEDLNTIREKNEAPPFVGKISLIKEKNGKVTLKRVLSNTNKETIAPDVKRILSGYKWTYELQVPYKIIDANTAPSYIDRKTNTVKWEISLSSLSKEPQEMRIIMDTFNPLIYFGIAGVIVVFVIIIVLIMIIKRKETVIIE